MMRSALSRRRARPGFLCLSAVLVLFLGVNAPAQQQQFVTPGPNVNIVGPTPDPDFDRIPDWRLKQQNEPSCVVRPNNPAYILCAFNDMRASDWPAIQGDGWIGVAESNDFGKTWKSRLAPGYVGHPTSSIGQGFAADPALVAIPGIGTPGMSVLSYIASFRDSDRGVLALQRYVDFNQEDGDFNKPETFVRVIDLGTEGRFIDKVASLYAVKETQSGDTGQSQPRITQSIEVEGVSEPIGVTTPDGVIVVAYSVFTGSGNSVKLYAIVCEDNGATCANPKKVSEELNVVTGVSLAYLPGKGISLTYRRSRDSNETDAIVHAFSSNLGKSWAKTETTFPICPFDQQASGATFRNFTFPWMADDGERVWVFSADRVVYDENEQRWRSTAAVGGCEQLANAPPGTYPGIPRIVGMSSTDGKNWYGSADHPDEPFILDLNLGSNGSGIARATGPVAIGPVGESPVGYQVLPFAHGTKGRVDVAWWDTRREEDSRVRPADEIPLIYDYNVPGARIFRSADVYMTRIEGCSATTGQGACTPRQPIDDGLLSPVRVSNYDTIVLPDGTVQEAQTNRLNLRTHASGTLAYNGDYGSIATPLLRKTPSGRWIQNSLPEQPDESGSFIAKENIFVAWGENRDIRIGDPFATQLLFAPVQGTEAPGLQAPGLQAPGFQAPGFQAANDEESAEATLAGQARQTPELEAVTEPDDDPTQPDDSPSFCSSVNFSLSRSRDTNVYSSLVEDVPTLVALTQSRRFNTVQRMFPLVISNPGTQPASYCLKIMNQPADYQCTSPASCSPARASFDPLPAFNYFDDILLREAPRRTLLEVPVAAQASAARSAFVTSSDASTVIRVNAYEGSCPSEDNPAFGNLVSTVELSDGKLFDPVFCEGKTDPTSPDYDPACDSVENAEAHNISLASPGLQAPILQAPGLQAPGLQAPGFQAPGYQAPGLQAPGFQAPGLQAPGYQAGSLTSPGLQAPGFQAPSLQAAAEGDIVYQDVVYVVTADGNVTSTYSGDIALFGLDPDSHQVQLIAWSPNIQNTTGLTAADGQCVLAPTSDNEILATADLVAPGLQAPGLQAGSLGDVALPTAFTPENQTPYDGALSFAAQPGEQVVITARIWATGPSRNELQRLDACYQAAENNEPAPAGCSPQDGKGVAAKIAFGAAAHGCSTVDVDTGQPGDPDFSEQVDCIDTGFEKIAPPDLIPPEFFPADGGTVTYEATSPAGAPVPTPGTLPDAISVSDPNLDPASVGCTSGTLTIQDGTTLFPFGDTAVTCTASDTEGNIATAGITVSVDDFTDPVTSVTGIFTGIEATGPDGATVSFTVSATDNTATQTSCSATGATIVEDAVTPGLFTGTFDVGTTGVSCTTTDQGGNSVIDAFDVSVVDTTPPVVTVSTTPVDTSAVEATGSSGASVSFTVSAVDLYDPSPGSVCTLDADGSAITSPATFAVGTTSVTCTATDSSGNAASAPFSVTVVDTTAPSITVPGDITGVEATGPDGAIVDFDDTTTYDVTATDTVDTDVEIVCTPASGSTFPLGTTSVECTATDDGGNTATDSFDIGVRDTTAPEFDPPLTDVTATASGLAGAQVTFTATATDLVDTAVDVSCTIPDGSGGTRTVVSGDTLPLGSTTVTCAATDNGELGDNQPPLNTTTETFEVEVALGFTGVTTNQNPNNLKTGSSIPLVWAWLDGNGTSVSVGNTNQKLEVYSLSCADQPGELVFDEDPGSSGFSQQGDGTYKFNFLAKSEQNGEDLPAARGGSPYCAIVTLTIDGTEIQSQVGDLKLKP
ncbi:HYR domain-containing protein [Lentisalinibacter salinarum]|uniref:HYR domain-containing protein n=1 Tax=Lentisalinibacter salinarum TaxID=2992239 RepID=UPI0038705219